MKKIVLASKSPRRRKILKKMGYNFEVVSPDFDETNIKIKNPDELVKTIAQQKAKSVLKKFKDKNIVIVAADTLVFFGNHVLGKPKDEKDAFNTLKMVSGKKCLVKTGFCLIDAKTGKMISDVDTTEVKMRDISNREIRNYISTGEPFDKSGSFAIEGPYSDKFVENIKGSYTNVVGLPKEKLKKYLDKILNE